MRQLGKEISVGTNYAVIVSPTSTDYEGRKDRKRGHPCSRISTSQKAATGRRKPRDTLFTSPQLARAAVEVKKKNAQWFSDCSNNFQGLW